MLSISDPSRVPDPRHVPTNMKDMSKDSITVFFVGIPSPKFRALINTNKRAALTLSHLEEACEAVRAETPRDLASINEHAERHAKLDEACEKARDAYHASFCDIVAWGVLGHDDFIHDKTKEPHPYRLRKEKWLGSEWEILSKETVDLYYRAGLIPLLVSYIVMYQNRTLPDFYKEKTPVNFQGARA